MKTRQISDGGLDIRHEGHRAPASRSHSTDWSGFAAREAANSQSSAEAGTDEGTDWIGAASSPQRLETKLAVKQSVLDLGFEVQPARHRRFKVILQKGWGYFRRPGRAADALLDSCLLRRAWRAPTRGAGLPGARSRGAARAGNVRTKCARQPSVAHFARSSAYQTYVFACN